MTPQHRSLWIISLINLVGLITIASLYFISPGKVVYVDSNRLINGYKGTEIVRNSIVEKTKVLRANIDTLTSEVRTAVTEFDKGAAKMTAKEKTLQQEVIKMKQQRLIEYQHAVETQMQQQESELTRNVLSEINNYVKTVGETKGYTIILAATDFGNIAFAKPELDITDEILEGLNNQYVSK